MRIAILATTFLTACAVETEDLGSDPPEAQCNLEYAADIGSEVADLANAGAPNLRVFEEGSAVTTDFIPDRTNIVFDQNGLITRVYCG